MGEDIIHFYWIVFQISCKILVISCISVKIDHTRLFSGNLQEKIGHEYLIQKWSFSQIFNMFKTVDYGSCNSTPELHKLKR